MKEISKVNTIDQIEEIYKAKYQIVRNAGAWLRAMREGNKSKATMLRRETNRIKREITEKYDILL